MVFWGGTGIVLMRQNFGKKSVKSRDVGCLRFLGLLTSRKIAIKRPNGEKKDKKQKFPVLRFRKIRKVEKSGIER